MTDRTPMPVATLGILALEGPDAAAFLQGQATCDARLVTATRGALGALCNLQGRMIVSFYVLPADNGLWLAMPRDRVAPVLSHLKKYAAFSKVMLRDASDLAVLFGDADGEAFTVAGRDGLPWMTLRGGRGLGVAPVAGLANGAAAGSAAWRAAAIAAGELLVDSANADKFLPQALNYDVVDGVSFRKGCYTGQEVVARMHFKGRMKERLYVATADTPAAPAAGSPVVDAAGKHVGNVVDAVIVDGRCRVAAVLRHDAVRAGALRLGDANGPVLAVGEQPCAFDRGEDA